MISNSTVIVNDNYRKVDNSHPHLIPQTKDVSKKDVQCVVLTIYCQILYQKCPFEAINIINLPSNLEKETTHRYNANSFKLHRCVNCIFLTIKCECTNVHKFTLYCI